VHFPRLIRPSLARLLRALPVRGRWRVAPLLNRLFPAEPVEARLPDVGRLRLDLADEDQLQIYWTGLHPDDARILRLVRTALPPDGIFVDVGANIGIQTLSAARHLHAGGAVVAFEPQPNNFLTLRHNVAQNGLRHVDCHNLGLANAPETLTCHGPARGGNWSLASRGEHSFEVRLIRLDDFLDEHPLPRLDMIKIDVEGAEVRVLRGACRTLARFRPLLVFEVCPAWLRRLDSSAAELLATVEGLGYTAHRLPDAEATWGPRVTAGELAALGPQDWTNLVGVPTAPVSRTHSEVLEPFPFVVPPSRGGRPNPPEGGTTNSNDWNAAATGR
jgi:FkbM family methyltransferase